jgi:adenine-specific DNA methylase
MNDDFQSQIAADAARNAEWAADRAAREARKAARETRRSNLLQLVALAQQSDKIDPKLQEQLERLIRAEAEQVERENSWTPTGCFSLLLIISITLAAIANLAH